jgi:ABC-2 type transport system ATP-binding protein
MIQTENLCKNYDRHQAVVDLNLDVKAGELFCFLGPNGAGKTTTIKMLTGLLQPTSGRAVVAGYDIGTDPLEAKRRIGYIPDRPYLYEKLSGRDFMTFVGDMFGVDRAEQRRMTDHYFELFSLSRVRDDFIENYSHGMRQKLVFSASLMHNPEVVVVDEPMVGLDPKSVRIVKDLLKQETRKGRTIFLSTHTLTIAEEIADRIGIIAHGKVQFLGTITEMRDALKRSGSLEELFLEITEEETAPR